jgi:exonuclease-1
MGIQGLLQALKPAAETCHIREYRGRVVGVDAYVWLHRGAYGCAYELCTGGAGASSAYIRYFLSMVDLLLEHGAVPYLVFDGGPLPAKAEQEALRSSRRDEATQLALQLQLQGDHAGARNQYVRAVDVNPEMAARVIHTIKQCRPSVKYVVAPYEADAQLSYLSREGIISAVITEDSDTLPYGCKDVSVLPS